MKPINANQNAFAIIGTARAIAKEFKQRGGVDTDPDAIVQHLMQAGSFTELLDRIDATFAAAPFHLDVKWLNDPRDPDNYEDDDDEADEEMD